MKRFVLLTSLAVLLGPALGAPNAAAEPTESGAGSLATTPPPPPTISRDDFGLGAYQGGRAGPAPLAPRSAAAASAAAAADVGTTSVICDGDGTSGKRIEVLYVREPSMPNRYTQLLPIFRAWLANADDQFNDAAAAQGYSRHLRYVTESAPGGGCQPVVRNVELPAGSFAEFGHTTNMLRDAGYNQVQDRKYLMLTEATEMCGAFVNWINEDKPTPDNWHNVWTTYGQIDSKPGCMGANAIAHELGHALGAVLAAAPHFTAGAHCTDGSDMLCVGSNFVCVEWNARRLPDCNGDDYFNLNPPAGSWLANHWNIANSDFFIKGNTPDIGAHPRVGSTYAITSVSTGGAIEVINGSTGQQINLSQQTRTDAPSQQWLVGYETGLQFSNVNSGLCMAAAGTTSGTNAWQQTCDGSTYDEMRWAYQPHGDGTYGILNWKSGLALTIGGAYPAPLQQQPYTGAANQRFQFHQLTVPAPQNNAVYTITGLGNVENMQVQNGSTASGALVTHAAPSTANSQRWRLQAAGTYWRLVNVNSNHCLDLVTANTTAGTQIRQATCNTSANSQQWTLRRLGDGTFIIVNRHSNLVLNMTTGSGSILNQQTLNANDRNRGWTLKPV